MPDDATWPPPETAEATDVKTLEASIVFACSTSAGGTGLQPP